MEYPQIGSIYQSKQHYYMVIPMGDSPHNGRTVAVQTPDDSTFGIDEEHFKTLELVYTPSDSTPFAECRQMLMKFNSIKHLEREVGAKAQKNLNVDGAKDDGGKPDPGIIFEGFPRALLAVAEVGTFGAKKYTRGGWQSVPDGVTRYSAAMGRHYLAEAIDPEGIDEDSGSLHMAQVAWNALARLELYLRNNPK